MGEDRFASRNDQIRTKHDKSKGMRYDIGYVDEAKVGKDGKLHYVCRLNGDQDHQGRHVRISAGGFKMLHVRLYGYQ